MKKIIQLKLKWFAKRIIAKYKPKIIGITGSVGKTSAKEAVFAVLSAEHNVRCSFKNYNNEIGVPLTIIGSDSPGRSIPGWFILFFKALGLLITRDKNYPDFLILEMGVDRPGDMEYLNDICRCDVGVVTMIGPSHLEYFGTIEKIQKEKSGLIKNLNLSGWAILNYDNEKTRQIAALSQARVLTYGFEEKADITAREAASSFEDRKAEGKIEGTSFKLGYKESYVPVLLNKVVGRTAIYAALAGAAVGISFGMNLLKIAEALKKFKSPPGRMNIILGVKNTLIIDDTYNSSPQSVIAALEIIKDIPAPLGKKFAVLGDMLELGSYSEEGHRQVGKRAFENGIKRLIVVGERSRDIARGAIEAGMNENDIYHFPDSVSASRFIEERIKENDLVFVKGSQGMRMEKLVKEIMAEPLRASELLVRQDDSWK